MDASDKSRFVFTPASALASRKIIEESSYTTTPNQSSADPTPPCGEAVYRKKPLDAEKLKTVNTILKRDQTGDSKTFKPVGDVRSAISSCEERTDTKSAGRDEAGEMRRC